MFQITVVELVSTTGEYILLFKVFVQTDSTSVILILMSFAIVPAAVKCICTFCTFRRRRLNTNIPSLIFKLLILTAPLLILISSISYFVSVFSTIFPHASKETQYLLPIAILMKSLVYWENFWTLRGKKKWDKYLTSNKSNAETRDTDSTKDGNKKIDDGTIKKNDDKYKICTNTVRVILTIAFIIVIKNNGGNVPFLVESVGEISTNTSIATSTTISTEFSSLQAEREHGENSDLKKTTSVVDIYNRHYLAFRLVVFSGIFPYFSALACHCRMQIFSFSLPLATIPILTWVLVYLAHVNDQVKKMFEVLLFSVVYEDSYMSQRTVIGIALWVSLISLTWYIWRPDARRMAEIGT